MIVLWGGVNAPWFSWLLPVQGEYAFVGSELAAIVSGGRALAVSFGTCGIDVKTSAKASHLKGISQREVRAEVFLRDPRMIESSRDIPNVNRCA